MKRKIARFGLGALMSVGIFLAYRTEANAQCGSKLGGPTCGGGPFVCIDCGCNGGGGSCSLPFLGTTCVCQ